MTNRNRMDRLDQDSPLAPAALISERLAVIPALALDRVTGGDDTCHSLIERALTLPGASSRMESRPQPEEVHSRLPRLLFAGVFLALQDSYLTALPYLGHGEVSCTEVIAKKEEDNPF